MIFGVTYSDDRMDISAERCIASMRHSFRLNAPDDLSQDFINDNRKVLESERGAGYWLWKPYVINDAMRSCVDGDILIYSDAGVEFIAPVNHIIDRMDEDIFFFTNGHPHVEWCKMDVIETIIPSKFNFVRIVDTLIHDELIRSHKQVQASVIFFKVNQKTRDFVKEWLLWCQMPGFIDDSPSKLPNYPTFAEHRHDQAILTCLQIKYGYKLHWWPTQYANHIRVEGDNYPVLFNHHRLRNNEYQTQLNPSY